MKHGVILELILCLYLYHPVFVLTFEEMGFLLIENVGGLSREAKDLKLLSVEPSEGT